MLKILQHPDPVLRAKCTPVELFDDALMDLAEDMITTMYDAPGRGLAAPQVGHPVRLFVMDTTWKQGDPSPRAFVNPQIIVVSDETAWDEEGCLSLIGQSCKVCRPVEVTLRYQDLWGEPHLDVFDGFAARCVQHERDHLDGILCIDHPQVAA